MTITWGHISNRTIRLTDLKKCVHQSLASLDDALTFALPLAADYGLFSLDDISDDIASPHSLFDRTDNLKVFESFIDKIWNALDFGASASSGYPSFRLSAGFTASPNKKKKLDVLERFKKVLDASLLALMLTCGVTPRAWQIKKLLYRRSGSSRRNIRLHKNGRIIITNPPAKQSDMAEYTAFWGLVHKLGTALVFYLGVIRPIEIRMLEELQVPVLDYAIYICVDNTKRTTGFLRSPLYNTTDVNRLLIKSDFGAETRVLRHVAIGILRQHFPELMRVSKPGDAPGDRQSQHKFFTGLVNYARDETLQGTGGSAQDCEQQLAVSYAIQEIYGLLSTTGYGPMSNVIDDIDKYKNYALATARLLVAKQDPGYSLGGLSGTADGVSCTCSKLMRTRPFLLSKHVRCLFNWTGYSKLKPVQNPQADEVLVQVTASLVYGEVTSSLNFHPPNGYCTNYPATAVALVSIILITNTILTRYL